MSSNARDVALETLCGGGAAAANLDRALSRSDLAPRDRAFATEIAYGTLKMRRALEWSVQSCLNRPFAEIEVKLRWILLLGAYQLLYLDRVPAHSAVDESVRLAKTHGHRGTAALVNAVLRKVAVTRPMPPRPNSGDGAASLGIYASLPDWIADHFIERFGFDDGVLAAEGMNAAPRRALRRSSTDGKAIPGITAGASRYGIPECLIVDVASSSEAIHAALASGDVAWQSEESQLAVHLLDPAPGETIIDACAGRGVKTMMIGQRLAGRGSVWSIDDDVRKLSALRAAARKSGFSIVNAIQCDAREPYPDTVPEFADAALVDAPCSGLGVLGRRADARWRKQPGAPERFSHVQAAVLRQAACRVRRGGRLLYATCSTHPAEDEAVVRGFLAEQSDWHSEAPDIAPSRWVRRIDDLVLTVPGIDGADGFFYAMLRREGSA